MAGTKTTMTAYINAETRQFQSKMDRVNKKLGGLGKSMKMLGGVMAGAFAVGKIVSFGKEASEMAGKLEGIQAAFNKLNKPDLLANLKTATRGTVNELELMKAAVQANNFKVPLEKLSTFFDFATKRASQTGESVDYLTNSLITGIGRKSALVMDNLGISAAELQSEIKNVGDFGKAAGNIIARELEKGGSVITTTAQKTARWAATMDNVKIKIGGLINSVLNKMAPAIDTVVNALYTGFGNAKKYIIDVVNYFIDLYNESMAVRVAVEYIKFTFKTTFEYIKAQLKTTIDAFGGLGKIIGAILKGDFESIPGIFKDTMKSMKGNYVEMGENIGAAFKEGIGNIVKKEKIAFVGIDETILPEAQAMGAKIGTAISAGMRQSMPGAGSLGEVQSQGLQNPIQQAPDLAAVFNNVDLYPATKGADKMVKTYDKLKNITNQLSPVFGDLTKSVVTGNKKMAKSAASAAKTIIGAAIAKAVASVVSSTIDKSGGPWGIALGAAAGAAALALFAAIVPSFATGGLAYGPTLAMVGDNPGAIRDPEVIAPLSKLQGMSPSVSLVGDWRISGDALQFVLDGYNQTMETTH